MRARANAARTSPADGREALLFAHWVFAGGTTCVALSNNSAVNGDELRRSAGAFNLEQGVSVSGVPATVVVDNGNTGTPCTITGTVSVIGGSCARIFSP